MTFSDIKYNDPNKEDPTRSLLRDYSLYNRKANKAIETERKAHPWWTLASGIASAFIPYGLGAWITPTANYMVQKHKEQVVGKQNDYRGRLGLQQNTNIPSSGLDLGGVGYSVGSSVATGLGRDTMPGNEKTISVSGGDMASQAISPFMPVTTSSQNLPTVDNGQGGQQIDLPQSDYWDNSGGGISGLYATTSQGVTQGSPTASTYKDGGKVKAPSHEEGGAQLLVDGKPIGFEIEGEERIVNDEDWSKILRYLKKNNNKSAMLLMKDIDKREPKKKQFADSGNTELALNGAMVAPMQVEQDPQLDFRKTLEPYFANVLPFKLEMPLDEGDNTYFGHPIEQLEPYTGSSYYNQPTVSETTITEKGMNPNFDWRNALGYGYDVARLGMGIEGALTPLPKWQIPQKWGEYMDKSEYLSKQGLLPESVANAKAYADANYATAVRDVTNAGGGNAAAVLGNLGAINVGRAKVASDLAEVDSKLKAANLKSYQNTLLQDIGMKKDIFNMDRDVAERTKEAGAGLMQSAISDLQQRDITDKFYGKGSYFEQMQEEQLKQGKSQSDIYAMQLDVLMHPEKYPSITKNLTEGDKKLIGDKDAIAKARALAETKETGLSKVLGALRASDLITTNKKSVKRK